MYRFISILSLIFCLWSCQEDKIIVTPTIKIEQASIKIKSNEGLTAGNSLLVMVKTQNKKNTPIKLIVTNDLVTYTLNVVTNKKHLIKGSTLTQSGLYTLAAIHRDSLIAKRKVYIEPSVLSSPLDIYTGPMSIVTGGKQNTMIVSVPSDSFGNGFIKSKNIYFQKLLDKKEVIARPVKNLQANYVFSSKDKARKTLIGVSCESVVAKEQAVIETADWTANYLIKVVSQHPYADNRQYLRLQTNKIMDRNDNQIADGTEVVFQVYENNMTIAFYRAITIDGVANVYIKNPPKPSTWDVKSSIGYSTVSNELRLDFRENITELLVEYDIFAKRIIVGPLKSSLGQYSPDGTRVTLIHNGVEHTQETIKGMTTFDLMSLSIKQEGKVTIRVSNLKDELTL